MMGRNFLARTRGRRFLYLGGGGKVRIRHYKAVFTPLAGACQGVVYLRGFLDVRMAALCSIFSGLFLRRVKWEGISQFFARRY